MNRHAGLVYALVTTLFWGVWGAFAGMPADHGFPETLIYVVWAVTMIPPALYALARHGWSLQTDARSVLLGAVIGLTGAGGQMLLFHAVHTGPTYLIFPLIALSPVVTIALSLLWLHERTTLIGAVGIVIALAALPLFDEQSRLHRLVGRVQLDARFSAAISVVHGSFDHVQCAKVHKGPRHSQIRPCDLSILFDERPNSSGYPI